MIGWIHGILREKHPPVPLVDTGGVGRGTGGRTTLANAAGIAGGLR